MFSLLVLTFMREPARGESETLTVSVSEIPPSLVDVLRYILQRPALLHLALSGALVSFAGYGLYAFVVSYLVRRHGVPLADAATLFGLIIAVPQVLGATPGGIVTDFFAKRDARWATRLPALFLCVSGLAYSVAFQQSDLTIAVVLIAVGGFFVAAFLGPNYAAIHALLTPTIRATAISLIPLVWAIVGLGLGPPLIGVLSDRLAARAFEGDFASACRVAVGGGGAVANPACTTASAQAVSLALTICSLAFFWAAFHMAWGGVDARSEVRVVLPAST